MRIACNASLQNAYTTVPSLIGEKLWSIFNKLTFFHKQVMKIGWLSLKFMTTRLEVHTTRSNWISWACSSINTRPVMVSVQHKIETRTTHYVPMTAPNVLWWEPINLVFSLDLCGGCIPSVTVPTCTSQQKIPTDWIYVIFASSYSFFFALCPSWKLSIGHDPDRTLHPTAARDV